MRKEDDDRSIEWDIMKKERASDVMLKNGAEKSPTDVYDNSGRLCQGVWGGFLEVP